MQETFCFISHSFISLQYIKPTASTYIPTSSRSLIWRQYKSDCSEIFSEKKPLFSIRTSLCTLNLTENHCSPNKTTFIHSIAAFLGMVSIFSREDTLSASKDAQQKTILNQYYSVDHQNLFFHSLAPYFWILVFGWRTAIGTFLMLVCPIFVEKPDKTKQVPSFNVTDINWSNY